MIGKDDVVIVKKRKRHPHKAHGGAWKVAYADFVTAMMAFFLVMWLVAQSPQVKASVGGYFRDPGVTAPPTARICSHDDSPVARKSSIACAVGS